MTYDAFLERDRELALLSSTAEAEKLVRAVTRALAERVERGAIEPVVEGVPTEVAAYFRDSETANPFQLDEFFRKVSKETGADIPATVQQCQAVIAVLRQSAGEDTMSRFREQLPVSWNRLFPTGRYYEPPAPRTT